MTVHAPFRFAPAHRWVHFPAWADLASHDVPFRDGLSGEIALEIEARTPLLIGGARRKANEKEAGEVWPYRLPDGRYAIPPSSLQGMVRSILEIAAFGKLGPWIDEKRFGIRDLTQQAQPFYQRRLNKTAAGNRITPLVKAGWLRRIAGGGFELVRSEMARVDYSELLPHSTAKYADWGRRTDAGDRYEWLRRAGLRHDLVVDPVTDHAHRGGQLKIAYRKARWAKAGDKTVPGRLVVTGATGASNPAKHMEFFFFADKPAERPEGLDRKYEEFLAIHQPEDGRPANPTWKFFRDRGYPGDDNKPFKDGGWMPIFYLEDDEGRIDSFGLAFMFKLAHKGTTHDLLRNSSPDHLDPKRLDLPSLIFGMVAAADEKPTAGKATGQGLKRRAAFDLAVTARDAAVKSLPANGPTVLMGPKPSYYPIYVRQAGKNGKLAELPGAKNGVAATYTPLNKTLYPNGFDGLAREHTAPEIAGAKVWPARGAQRVMFPAVPRPPDRSGPSVHTRLHALPAGTRFATTLRFHNLRPEELGAVLWALTFGRVETLGGAAPVLHHRIGMGKPFGLGEIAIRFAGGEAAIRANDGSAAPAPANLVGRFVAHMADTYRASHDPGGWQDSVQIKTLLRAASADANADENLQYMELGKRDDSSSYVGAKSNGLFLASYIEVPPQPSATAVAAVAAAIEARVMLKVGAKTQGIIKAGPFPDGKDRAWMVLLEGETKPRRYKESLLTVIAPPPAPP
jgi:CRISPR-associated protein (TIGR03986 family)